MKTQIQWIVSSILLLATGIFVLASPTLVVKFAVIVFGFYLMAEAVYALFLSWAVRKVSGVFTVNSVRTLASLAVGILVLYFAFTSSGNTVASWTVYLVAGWLALGALFELVEIWILRRNGYETFGAVTGPLVSLVLALLMFLFPVMINNAVFTVVGIVLIIVSVFMIFWGIRMISSDKRDESETDWSEL